MQPGPGGSEGRRWAAATLPPSRNAAARHTPASPPGATAQQEVWSVTVVSCSRVCWFLNVSRKLFTSLFINGATQQQEFNVKPTGVAKDRTTPTAVLSLAIRSLGLISIGPLEPTICKRNIFWGLTFLAIWCHKRAANWASEH